LIEASRNLRLAQHTLLCGPDNPLKECEIGYESTSKAIPGLKIIWTEDLRFVPQEASKAPFVIAHEFFDALPVHVFQSVSPAPSATEARPEGHIQTPTGPIKMLTAASGKQQGNQWRELVVSPVPPHRLKQGETEFELTVAKAATPHSMYLPETSPRYQALKNTDGATIEISPESQAYTADIAARIGGGNPSQPLKSSSAPPRRTQPQQPTFQKPTPSGAALLIDYGPPSTIPSNSLRGIKSHRLTSPFLSPGRTDVSADVDFLGLAHSALNASPGVEVHGPVSQGVWLEAMGIQQRAAQLVKSAMQKANQGEEKAHLKELVQRVESGWKRLVDQGPNGMGALYQVMAIVPHTPPVEGQPRRRPVGFGGDVVG
jgi:NADH dehydrogenase [ubiquinone] 1 alpha subcomplex assembly factor 7